MNSAILRWTTLLAIASAVIIAVLGIISQFYPPVRPHFHWYMSVLLLVVAAHMTYVYTRMEFMGGRLKELERSLGPHVMEVFRTRDELFTRMIEVTVGSQSVSTQMFSDPPGEIGGLMEVYFRKVGAYTRKNQRTVFRRIATLGDSTKSCWLLEVLAEMYGAQNFSLAYIDLDHRVIPLLCLHLVEREGQIYSFLFHTIPPTGSICAFLVRSNDVGRVLLDYYNGLWERAPKLMEGKQINLAAIQEIADRCGFKGSPAYDKIIGKKPASGG